MKILIAVIAVAVLAGGAFVLWKPADAPQAAVVEEQKTNTEAETNAKVVADGSYEVVPAESTMKWSAKKPLIEGYVNSGTIDVKEGTIDVAGNKASGSFTIDMNTLHVGLTATKPGKESALEGHLKGDGWFDVAQYPTSSFMITSVEPRADSDTTFVYDVTGNLTLKGQTHEITFPATISLGDANTLRAKADFEIDRTKWGITAGSANFFDSLAENAISDTVAMSFDITARKQ